MLQKSKPFMLVLCISGADTLFCGRPNVCLEVIHTSKSRAVNASSTGILVHSNLKYDSTLKSISMALWCCNDNELISLIMHQFVQGNAN